jgi:hypothetical protein
MSNAQQDEISLSLNATTIRTALMIELARTRNASTLAAWETHVDMELSAMLKTTEAFADVLQATMEIQKSPAMRLNLQKQVVDQTVNVPTPNRASTRNVSVHATAVRMLTASCQIIFQCALASLATQEIHNLVVSSLNVRVTLSAPTTKLATTPTVSIHVLWMILVLFLPSAMAQIISQHVNAHQDWKVIHSHVVKEQNVILTSIVPMTKLARTNIALIRAAKETLVLATQFASYQTTTRSVDAQNQCLLEIPTHIAKPQHEISNQTVEWTETVPRKWRASTAHAKIPAPRFHHALVQPSVKFSTLYQYAQWFAHALKIGCQTTMENVGKWFHL